MSMKLQRGALLRKQSRVPRANPSHQARAECRRRSSAVRPRVMCIGLTKRMSPAVNLMYISATVRLATSPAPFTMPTEVRHLHLAQPAIG